MKNLPPYAAILAHKKENKQFRSQFHKQYEELNIYSTSDFVLVKELMKIDLADEYYKQLEIQDVNEKEERNRYQIQKYHKLMPRKQQIKPKQQLDVIEIIQYSEQKMLPVWKSAEF
ncbi:Hypothetical_protein [Hexamita inflata]|uniref:Hypothetical_protein n=1 Tax=Hexamita inflata TaxID=28002 RepID=A0ABP1HLI5_9EUKA